jgi:hypothetical protein
MRAAALLAWHIRSRSSSTGCCCAQARRTRRHEDLDAARKRPSRCRERDGAAPAAHPATEMRRQRSRESAEIDPPAPGRQPAAAACCSCCCWWCCCCCCCCCWWWWCCSVALLLGGGCLVGVERLTNTRQPQSHTADKAEFTILDIRILCRTIYVASCSGTDRW